MQQDLLQTLRWVRTFGDVVFIIGALAVAWQVVKGLYLDDRNTLPTLGGGVVNTFVGGAVATATASSVHGKNGACCGSCGGSEQS